MLELSNNALVELPDSIGQCERLRELRLDGNALAALPEDIGALTQLRVLWLFGNKELHEMPNAFERLRVQELWLRDD